jgi:hypothetical protein
MPIGSNDKVVKASLMFWLYVATRENMYTYDPGNKTLTLNAGAWGKDASGNPYSLTNLPPNIAALDGGAHAISNLLAYLGQNPQQWQMLLDVQQLFHAIMTSTTIFLESGKTNPPYHPGGGTCPDDITYLNELALAYP